MLKRIFSPSSNKTTSIDNNNNNNNNNIDLNNLTINEIELNITEILNKNIIEIDEILNEIGYDTDQQKVEFMNILNIINKIFNEKLLNKKNEKKKLINKINIEKKKLINLGNELNIEINIFLETIEDDDELTLLEKFESIKEQTLTLSKEKEDRLYQFNKLGKLIAIYHERLDIDIPIEYDTIGNDLSLERHDDFIKYCLKLKNEIYNKVKILRKNIRIAKKLIHDLKWEYSNGIEELIYNIDILNENEEKELELKYDENEIDNIDEIKYSGMDEFYNQDIDINKINDIKTCIMKLEKIKIDRKEILRKLGDEISVLWELLEIPDIERQRFTSNVNGLGLDTLEMGRKEKLRLLNLKREKIGYFIYKIRDEINEMWDEMYIDESDRKNNSIMNISEENFSDDVLKEHEIERDHIYEKLLLMRPILKGIIKREELLRERIDYEELIKDSSRLLGRKAGQLERIKEEEKMRKRVQKDLPKLTNKLIEKILEWESNEGPFIYQGERYIDIIERVENEWEREKQNTIKIRKNKNKIDNNNNFKFKKTNGKRDLYDNNFDSIIPKNNNHNRKKRLNNKNKNNKNKNNIKRGIDFKSVRNRENEIKYANR